MVNQILTDNPVDPTLDRYCKPIATDPIEDAATWADDYRKGHPETAGWHFIDIPRGSKKGSYTCDAVQSCITLALAEQVKILQDPASDPTARANALRFIIHFAGDIHQPLHCTTNNDRGGNCVPVTYFGQKPLETDQITKTYQLNLHGVWDTQLVERIAGIETVEQFAATIEKRFKPQFATWKEEGVNFDNWAWESHEYGRNSDVRSAESKDPGGNSRAGELLCRCGRDLRANAEAEGKSGADISVPGKSHNRRATREGRLPPGDDPESDLACSLNRDLNNTEPKSRRLQPTEFYAGLVLGHAVLYLLLQTC